MWIEAKETICETRAQDFGRIVGDPEIIHAKALPECGKVGWFSAEHSLNFRLQMEFRRN